MKVSRWIVPILIVLLIAAGLSAAGLFAIPSVTVDFPVDEATGTELIRTVEFVVDGVMCVDTASRACSTLYELPGVIRYVAYASHNRVEITFDPARTNVEAIREAIEGPVYDEESEKFLFHLFQVLEIDREERRR
jgi:hypothetical protein